MVFSRSEVESILKKHVEEKIGVDAKSIGTVNFRSQTHEGKVLLTEADVYVLTEETTAIPAGPYRTSAK